MKSHSRSILYVVNENDKDIPFNDIMNKCKYVFFKMSNFNKPFYSSNKKLLI